MCVCVCKKHFHLKIPFLLVRNFAQIRKRKMNIEHFYHRFSVSLEKKSSILEGQYERERESMHVFVF